MMSPSSKTKSKPTPTGLLPECACCLSPNSERFEEGVKYAYHYGEAGADEPIIRFDNHHGPHELHLGENTFDIDFPGLAQLYRAWRAALPPEKRADW